MSDIDVQMLFEETLENSFLSWRVLNKQLVPRRWLLEFSNKATHLDLPLDPKRKVCGMKIDMSS